MSINVNIVQILHIYEPCKIVIVIEQLVKIYDCRVCILITVYLKLQFVYQLENEILELKNITVEIIQLQLKNLLNISCVIQI